MGADNSNRRLAVDVGGTFIDFVTLDPETGEVSIEKVRSAGELHRQFMQGVERLGVEPRELDMIVHGSTMVINTIVQENGARVALITTAGFRDVLELGRGGREDIYDLFYKPPPPLVPRFLRFEVPERMDARGAVVTSLDENAAARLADKVAATGVGSVAICFLHAYKNPAHERRMAEILAGRCPGVRVSISSDVVREWREFERTSTTVLNSYTRPRMETYLQDLEEELSRRDYRGAFAVMQSSGGITSGEVARNVPIRTVQSGPAGGVIGVRRLCEELGIRNAVVADVGGTTFDVSLIHDGHFLESGSARFNRRPVLQPTIDIVSIGAGGGSIAWIDREGGLQVGPQSAQADPGPACFGLGGTEPTVTDAQLVLGYLDPETFLGKRIALDKVAAEAAITGKIAKPLDLSLEDAAAGIMHIAAMNMAYAVRQITVERGHDPREFSLVCIGGGGGLFAGALVRELELTRAIIPRHPAVFSAWGLLNADYREDLTRSWVRPLEETDAAELEAEFDTLIDEAKTWLGDHTAGAGDLHFERFAEMRYLGQEHTIRVPVLEEDFAARGLATLRQRFDRVYEKAYAHALPDHAVEFVILRLVATGPTERPKIVPLAPTNNAPVGPNGTRTIYVADQKRSFECTVFERDCLDPGTQVPGPAIVEEWTTTILVPPGQAADVDHFGNLSIAEAP